MTNNDKLKGLIFAGRAAVMLAVALLAACGGDVNVDKSEGPPDPSLPVAITPENAIRIIEIQAAATELVMHLSTLGVEMLVLTAESGETNVSLPCSSGSIELELNDIDLNGQPSRDDTAAVTVTDCLLPETGYTSSGTFELSIRNFFAKSFTSARAKFQYEFKSPMTVTLGDTEAAFLGKLDAEYIGNTSAQTLVATISEGDSLFVRTVTPEIVRRDTFLDLTVSRDISTTDLLTTSVEMLVESITVGGAFSCSTNAGLTGPLGQLPRSGEIQCMGAADSAARVTGDNGGAASVSVDAEGDGSFDPVPAEPGSSGTWLDFFNIEYFTFRSRIPEEIPEEEPPSLDPQSAAYEVNDVVVSPDGARIYIVNDAGLTTVDAANLSQIDQLNLSDTPSVVAISDDGSTLWIGFADASEIVAVDTASLSAGPRHGLGAGRIASRIRVRPGEPDTVVVAMQNGDELIAFDNGAPLPGTISAGNAPELFEFADADTIVGHDTDNAEFPASVIAVGPGGLNRTATRREFDILPANDVALGNEHLFSTTGRVTNPEGAYIEGRIKLDQLVELTTNQDGIATDRSEGVVYLFNAEKRVLESFYEDTFRLRSAHTISTEGTFVRMVDANNRFLIANESRIYIIDKVDLGENANLSPCETRDLSGRTSPGFAAQIDCGVNDALYDPSRDVFYASLPSFAGVNGNSVAIVDASSGNILETIFVGSEPGDMALTADGNTLYVTLREATKYAIIDLQAGVALPPVILELNLRNDKPVFIEDVAVSPTSASTVLLAGAQEIAVYEAGARLPNVVSFYGPVRDAFIDQDGSSAFVQKSGGGDDVLGILTLNALGVTLTGQDSTTLVAGSLKLQDSKFYDRDGTVANASNLAILGTCDASSPFGTVLVEPSANSSDIFYVDRSADSTLTVCSESSFTVTKQVQVPLSGSLNSAPLTLEEAGADRLIMTSNDKLIIFRVGPL